MITQEMLVNEVRKVIAERPDYIYTSSTCSYLKCKEECVFGRVLSNLGFTQEELQKVEGRNVSHILDVYEEKFSPFTKNVILWAAKIQIYQDFGISTWQQCLNKADEIYPVS